MSELEATEELKTTTPAFPATGRTSTIKSILKNTTTATSELPSTPTSKNEVTRPPWEDAGNSSPRTKRRGILKKQLSFETDEPGAVKRQCPSPPPPLPTELQPPDRPDLVVLAPTPGTPVPEDTEGQGSVAVRTTRIKNKAVARRLMSRDRRSFDDETMASFPGDSNDGR